jgi:glycosyltransferase involved in cell wall biosynthesis
MPTQVPSSNPRMVFLRGVDFSNAVGASDWRIALYMPEFGFNTAVLGRGVLPSPGPKQVELVSMPVRRVPVLETLALSCLYAIETLRRSPDIIIANPGVALAGALCKAVNPRIKLILDIRTIPVESRGCVGRIHCAYFDTVLRSSLFDACSVISEGMLDTLDRQFELKARLPTFVWGSGFDQEIFVPAAEGPGIRQKLGLDGKFVLMFHGSLSPARGLGEVIQSLRLLRDRGERDLHLVLIGHGAAEQGLINLATELNVADQIRCMPPMAHDAIPDWIAVADLGLDPLPDHPWWRHQSPLKVYEYLAMGKPVLATDLPCHRDISEAVILVPENQPSTLAEAILRIRRLPVSERRRLSRVARRDAEQHTWRVKAQALARFLHELIGRV